MIENTRVEPAQVFDKGVTVIWAVTGIPDAFVATKELMVPEPLAARPMDVVLLTQLYVVLPTDPEKVTAVVLTLLHTTWLLIAFTVGVGLTVIENDLAVPLQLFDIGVIVITAVTGTAPELVAVNELIVPTPLAARPIDVVVFDQL